MNEIGKRRCRQADFLLDLLDFMEEKMQEAVSDPAAQRAAIVEAAGVVPLLRDRLRHHPLKQTQFMAVLNKGFTEHWESWWDSFATANREDFLPWANDFLKPDGIIEVLREVSGST